MDFAFFHSSHRRTKRHPKFVCQKTCTIPPSPKRRTTLLVRHRAFSNPLSQLYNHFLSRYIYIIIIIIMEFCLRRLEHFLPATAVEKVMQFELTARNFETKRKEEMCEHVTFWNKQAVRREIEHSSAPILERFRIPLFF